MNRKQYAVLVIILLACCFYSRSAMTAPFIEATFGADGESGIYFDPLYNAISNEAQTSMPGINFAGAGGVGVSLAQVHEFDAAASSSLSGGEGYFMTDSTFTANTGLTITPLYTNVNPAQSGATYVLQHYTVENLTASAINSIWFMSYLNADLVRATTTDIPPQRVGLLNDESITMSAVAGSSLQNISVRQYQDDGTEIFAQSLMFNGTLSAVDAYMIAGPGTISGGGDYVYDQIMYNGASHFTDAQSFYAGGVPIEYSTEAEYAFAMAFNIGTLSPGEVVEIVVAVSTEDGNFAEEFFSQKYPLMLIPEPATVILMLVSLGAVRLRKRSARS